MSGSNSSSRGSGGAAETPAPLSFAVHSMPSPAEAIAGLDAAARKRGRLRMLLVLLVCAAPVVASYLAYYVIRPDGRTNYSELIQPLRPIPADLPLADLQGQRVAAETLKGQWLLVVVAGGACDATCERYLWIQRQLREALGREKERVDKIWLIPDAATPDARTLRAIDAGQSATVLRVPSGALGAWLQPGKDHTLEQHLYLVDPLGNWMMRVPADPDPAKLKRDIDRLLRAATGWDEPGR